MNLPFSHTKITSKLIGGIDPLLISHISSHHLSILHPTISLMPFHKGFRATIYDSTTSVPLTEYAPFIDPTTDTVTSYLQTTVDSQPKFTSIPHDTVNTFSQGTTVYVDGVYVDNGLTGPGIATERRWFGKRIDHIHVRPFIFRANPCSTSPQHRLN